MLDLNELRDAIRNMKYKDDIYRLLKEELTKLGNWKNRPRGNPRKGYQKSRFKK